ncbi:MAG: hypothetical protein K0R26_1914 [Bacteroidota bacterium]|jgi:hypothetical protein|nr:hypothetical protein [Bacteroidota bacterium]
MQDNFKPPNSAKELRLLYEISRTTWWANLKTLVTSGKVRKFAKVYSPKELEYIVEHLGAP